MTTYSLSRLSNEVLLGNLRRVVALDRGVTAELLAYLAEVDKRRLYLPAGYPTMYEYCVQDLGFSEDAACKRIRAARAAREFPAIFAAVADGRLHLSGVVMLAPHLQPDTADELLGAAAHKTKLEIERLIAERFPRPDAPARVQALSPTGSEQWATGPVVPSAPGRMDAPVPPARVKPMSAERYAVQFAMSQEMHDKLRYIQELLGHQVSSGDIAEVVHRSFDAFIAQLEKRKFAATGKPRSGQRRASPNPRHISADIKRTVWARDGGRCTFVGDTGRRGAHTARIRSRRGRGARWRSQRRRHPVELPSAQPVHGRVRVQRGVHEAQARGAA